MFRNTPSNTGNDRASTQDGLGCATVRHDGYFPLEAYGVLGDGRSVVLSGADGSLDWRCVPNLDSPPLFDRMLDADKGGHVVVAPVEAFTVEPDGLRIDPNAQEQTLRGFGTGAGERIQPDEGMT